MKKTILTLLLFLLVIISSLTAKSQSYREYHFTSYFQVDKTFNGSLKKDTRKVSIYFRDPKPNTKITSDTDVEDLPTGELIIKYEELKDPIVIEIKYFGKYTFGETKNQALYGISKTWLDYNAFIYVNKPTMIAGKIWNNVLMIANMDSENGDINRYTVYCCNETKAIEPETQKATVPKSSKPKAVMPRRG